ncbi:hypothetical protein CFC21_090637 [Triticum aestivum]|uniref:Uncharacterized protein n=4 Tax=Triticum aestivum TaxID=4565 RepID=A0A3B6PTP4_WHEAT|nr:uncharacterized protein LOC123140118 [Triticum aestivum]KAF7087453.1 hypothetical protein CFC21_090637 [Triticum aestivum]
MPAQIPLQIPTLGPPTNSMAAAGDDAPAGLFSGVWSRLHAAASLWRRRGQASRDGEREEEGEATVRSRLARRAAAARRVGRKLAFVSFNLEVLVFVYAFWRARRRSLTWRQPIQVLPVLAVPALATLIYAAFVRFTRMLDLKDKRTLERLQEDKPQNECEPRESVDLKDKETLERLQEDKQQTECEPRGFDRNKENDVQNCDGVDDASNSLVEIDSAAQTAKLMKHRHSSIKHRDDGGADMAWGHSKDFQSAPSGGLRMRRLSSSKTYMTSSSFIERSVEKTQETPSVSAHSDQHVHVPISTEDTISYPFDDCRSMHAQPSDTPQELSEGDADEEGFDGLWDIVETRSNSSKENPISPVGSHNNFYDGDDSRSLASPPDDFVAHNSLNDFSGSPDLSGPVLPASETLKMLPPESVREEALLDPQKSEVLHMYSLTPKEIPNPYAVNAKELPITPDMGTYQQLLGEGVEETESSMFHIPEESTPPFISEEVLLCPPAVSNIEHCLGTPEFSLCGQETEKMEVVRSVSFTNDSPESSFLSSPELVVESAEDAIEKEICELNTKEENAMLISIEEEPLQDPLIVSTSTSEQCLETSDVSLCIQDAKAREVTGIINFVTANPELMQTTSPELLAEGDDDLKGDKASDLHLPEQNGLPLNFEKESILDSLVAYTAEDLEITEVHDVVKEGSFESEDEETFSHPNLVVPSSNDDSKTQKLISDSMRVQFIPNTKINEGPEGGRETVSEPLHQGTRHSEGMFLSPGEINNDEVYSLTPMESPTLYAVNDKELPITPDMESYPEFVGEGVEEIVLSKFHMREESTTPFNSEEVLPCSLAVSNIENCPGAPEFPVCGEETDKMEVAGSVSFINVSPELSFLSSPELVVENAEDVTEKELSGFYTKEDNAIVINMEEEALQDPLMVSTSAVEQCLETSDVSLRIQDANPKLVYPPSPEVLGEYNEELKEDQTSDSHIPEQNGLPFNFEKEPILDSPVADTAEDVEITEVHYVVKKGFSESEGEEAFNYQKLAVTDSEDDSDTQNLIIDSMPVKFIPNSDLNEILEGGREAFSQPLRQSTRHSEGMFLSSAEINNDEVYSSNSNSYAKVVEDAAPSEGLSKVEDEMSIASLDTPICLDEVKSADIDMVSPKLSLQAELRGGGVEENEQSKFPLPVEIRTHFNLEEEVLLSPVAVNNTEYCVETPEFSLYNHESGEMEVVESVSYIKVSPESIFLSSPEFVGEGGQDAREKETRELNTNEENETLINLKEEPLQAAPVVSTTDQCLETSEFSLSSEVVKTTDVPEIVSFVTVSPELNYPASPELLSEGDGDLHEDETSDSHLHEQKALPSNLEEPFLDPLVVDTAEDALVTSELLIFSEEVKMTEVHGVVEEVFSESEDEAAFDHPNLVLASPDDDSTAENFTSNSISAQVIPDTSVKEASQAGQEALPEPRDESICHSEGTFLSPGEVNHDEVTVEAPFSGQEGLPKSEDEIALTSLETSILLDEVTTAENLTANSGPSQSIPDSNGFQSLHDQEQAPSETLQDVNFLIEGSHTSSEEGINSEIFSLYSRSSSCVSEISMLESLRSGTSSEPENDRGLSFDERNHVIFHNMDSTENNTNNPGTAESILETNMTETLNIADETTPGSPHEVSSNFVDSFVAPDVTNGMTQSDQHLDLSSSSFAPVVDAFETLQSGHVFSEPQLENDVTFGQTQMSPKEADDAENYFTNTIDDPQDSERTSTVALEDEDDLTLHKAYMSPEDISEVENSLADDSASDLPHMPENHCFSEKVSPESQDPLSSEVILVHPVGLKTENDLDDAKSSLYSTEANLAEPCGIAHEGTQQQDETMLGFEEANSEDHYDNSGSLDIPDVTVAESLQAAERSSSEILYDGMFSFEGTLISLDGNDNAEDFTNNSGSAMHTAQTDTTSLPGLQEGSFKPEDENAVNSISPYEVDTEESSSSNRGNSSSASSRHDISFMEAPQPQELPIDARKEKVFLKDKEPKDGESEDTKETVEDLDSDHERKPVVTISHSTGSSNVSELADLQYTESVDDDTETLSAPLPSSVATDISKQTK